MVHKVCGGQRWSEDEKVVVQQDVSWNPVQIPKCRPRSCVASFRLRASVVGGRTASPREGSR